MKIMLACRNSTTQGHSTDFQRSCIEIELVWLFAGEIPNKVR